MRRNKYVSKFEQNLGMIFFILSGVAVKRYQLDISGPFALISRPPSSCCWDRCRQNHISSNLGVI